MYLLTPEEMRNMDERAIEEFHIPSIILMENAAIRVVDLIEKEYGALIRQGKVLIFVGRGNNGGDGLAIGRHLFFKGIEVELILAFKDGKMADDASINLDIFKKIGGTISYLEDYFDSDKNFKDNFFNLFTGASLIIDGIFGTGLSRPIDGYIYRLIEFINDLDIAVLAIDIPSGINGYNGQIEGIALKAENSVTFAYGKIGHFLYPARDYVGKVHIEDIGIPRDSVEHFDIGVFTLDDEAASKLIKERPASGHKGNFGKVAVIAGSLGMVGAAHLTSMGALRSGSGLVTLACPKALLDIYQIKLVEAMTFPLEDKGLAYLSEISIEDIDEFLKNKDVLALGPGIGQREGSFKVLEHIMKEKDISLVLDADGLNLISKNTNLLKEYEGEIVITPHPGEMSRLIGKSIDKILKDPIKIASDFAKKMGITVLLKGGTSIVASKEGRVYLNTSGNSGMATAGSGDVLTGIIASLIGQGYSTFEGAVLGAYLHGRAGDIAERSLSKEGILAGDILNSIPHAYKAINNVKK